jgi:hypothetical protein
MINPPKTIEEARRYYYKNYWDNHQYREKFCAYEVDSPGSIYRFHQCFAHNGHGINGLYCKQHAVIVERAMKNGMS